MQKILRLSFWIQCISLLYASAGGAQLHDGPAHDQGVNPIFFPSTPGTWWTYDMTRYVFPDSTVSSQMTITITSADTLPSGVAASRWRITVSDSLLVSYIFPFAEDSIVYIAQSRDSVMLYRSLQDTVDREALLRFPLILGQSWGESTWNSFADSLDSIGTIKVTAGIFDSCVHITRHGGWWQFPTYRSEWLKQAIGFIQVNHFQPDWDNAIFTMKLRAYHLESASVDGPTIDAPTSGFALEQNYPNPFNPVTLIEYSLPRASHVTMKLYDILGRDILTLLNHRESIGIHRIRFDASNLPTGVYFYRLQADNFLQVRKLLYLK